MLNYELIIGRKETNFAEVQHFRDGIIKINKKFDEFLSKRKETEYTNPFNCDLLVIAVNPKALGQNQVRGFARLSVLPDGHAELDSAYVEPKDTRRGLYSKMIDLLMQEADERGIKEIMALPAIGDEFLIKPLQRRGFESQAPEAEMWRRK